MMMVATLISTAFMALLLLSGWSIIHDITRPLDLISCDAVCRHRLENTVTSSPQQVQHVALVRPARAVAMPQFARRALAA
jgi:hypothetical protein